MKKPLAFAAQAALVVLGIATLVFLIVEPTREGVNVGKPLAQVYFDDWFLAYAYLASVPFFVGLYQGFRALGRARTERRLEAARSLRIIRACALLTIPFVIGGEAILFSMPSDDRPPLLAMGTLIILCSIAVAFAATRLERRSLRA